MQCLRYAKKKSFMEGPEGQRIGIQIPPSISQEKIRQVHQAVIKGDVKDVKELLTRKRFALSRDVNGASPLHLSILYGHPEVLK